MPIIKFNTDIYKKKAIEKTIADYSHLAKFSMSGNKKYIEVNISNIDNDVKDILMDEFKNYCLGMTKKYSQEG